MQQNPPASTPTDESLTLLKSIYEVLVFQHNARVRNEELLCYGIEEQLQARKREQLGPLALTATLSQVYSQNYEDGMIAEIFTRIGPGERTFVEIGVQSGIECNTRLLLQQGWRGLWVEGSEPLSAGIRQRFAAELGSGQLKLVQSFLTRENINEVVQSAGFGGTVDFLSIDIDQNTSHVWRALHLKARVACIEYNPSYPPSVNFEVPYSPTDVWDGSNYFGGLLKALEEIGRAKGQSLVACDLTGSNAFFVDSEIAAGKFAGPFDAETHYEPARYKMLKMRGHPRAR